MMQTDSLFKLISHDGEAPALLAPGRAALSRAALRERVALTLAEYNRLGVSRGDSLALVLPDGPDLALAFLAAACGCVSAPLNPAYREAEYDFYLGDLAPRAVVLPAGADGPARAAARRAGIAVIELYAKPGAPAGSFELHGSPANRVVKGGHGGPDDLALVLHTSGTTARPKIVPLSQGNLCASAANVAAVLALEPADRCLNIMPLFHIHGLVAGLLAPLASGGSLICPPGFTAARFFAWLAEFQPTWYSAVPTMHQAVLARSAEKAALIAAHPLRLIRSSSAPLAPAVMAELERVFNAPVIEAYGMTEAAHQMASNHLPPGRRTPGTVGQAAGPEIAIMAEDRAELLDPGCQGEIVIRGPNVMSGYLNNPEANARAFSAGWLRTGDLGRLEEDGTLTLLGRLKEIINRGGEKISPREVDEVLLQHPGVRQALAFALADERLGEVVAAAVVLRDGSQSTGEDELRRFCALRLADFKVPARIAIVPEIPKGPTGKPQRIGLAEKLGLQAAQPPKRESIAYTAPAGDLETNLLELWGELLEASDFGTAHTFLSLGGDSLLASRLAVRYCQNYEIQFSLIDFFNFPTVAGHARLIEERVLAQVRGLSDEEAARQSMR